MMTRIVRSEQDYLMDRCLNCTKDTVETHPLVELIAFRIGEPHGKRTVTITHAEQLTDVTEQPPPRFKGKRDR